jgi:ATP-dependent DNA helicase RecG
MPMKPLQLSSRIESAPLVNEKRGEILRQHGIRTVEDLLWYLPFRYEDWRSVAKISELKDGEIATVAGTILRNRMQITARRRFRILDITLRDSSGGILIARFFNQPYLKDHFEKGETVVLHGVIRSGGPISAGPVMENPQHEKLKGKQEVSHFLQIRPIYERIGAMTPKMLRWLIRTCLDSIPSSAFGEPLPEDVKQKYKLIDRKAAVEQLHFPTASALDL